jgi:predicted RNase H-like HicB family nuclease
VQLTIETELEDDGRWIAEVREIPGAMVYGPTREAAMLSVQALALRVLSERIELGEEPMAGLIQLSFIAA